MLSTRDLIVSAVSTAAVVGVQVAHKHGLDSKAASAAASGFDKLADILSAKKEGEKPSKKEIIKGELVG